MSVSLKNILILSHVRAKSNVDQLRIETDFQMLLALQLLLNRMNCEKVIANNPREVETTANSHTCLKIP